MDAFEQLIASLLERDGFWVRSSVKVKLTKEEKVAIKRHSSPRWELDLVAYKGSTNELWVVECKSYLDSSGVSMAAFDGTNKKFAGRFKLFNDDELRKIVFARLIHQLTEELGACAPNPSIKLVLAAGRISNESHRTKLVMHFQQRGWLLWDPHEIRNRLLTLADESYENAIASVVSKILLRGKSPA